ncbi:MAG: hypothetical protein GY793_12160 [Proteobacteria bacterium]|nr:hypothetical protein [Pseudomonadota bacterium]
MNRLEKIRKEVLSLTDRLGKKVDLGIFDLVVALRFCAFKTTGSCEGHIEREVSFAPWVSISTISLKYAKHIRENEQEKEALVKQENLEEHARLVDLLDIFYTKRNHVSPKYRLTCFPRGWNASGLAPSSKLATSLIVDLKQREKIHEIYHKEVKAFANFLLKSCKQGKTE